MKASVLVIVAACGGSAGEVAPPDANARVSGAVVDAHGVGWPAAKIQVCSATVCTIGDASATGAFEVAVPRGDRYHVIARPAPGDARDGSAGIGVLDGLLAGDETLAEPVVLPVTGARVALGASPTAAAVTPDLTLTASATDLDFYGDAYVAAVRLDPDAWPALSVPGKTVLAIWALNPWGTRASKAVPVTIQNSFSLAPGDAAAVYAVDEATAALGPPAEASVSADGATLASSVDRLTWIVLAR